MRDLEQLTNAIERREDRSTRRNEAQLAREYVIALPHELDAQQREHLLKNIIKEGATRKGMVAMWAIHEPDREGDNRNHHAHVILTMREIDPADPDGFGEKARDWNSKKEMAAFKGIVERETNKMLERAGVHEKIAFTWSDGRETTQHMGHDAAQLERQGIATRIGNENRAIQARNAERQQIKAELTAIDSQRAAIEQEPPPLALRRLEAYGERKAARQANPTRDYSTLRETHAQVAEALQRGHTPQTAPPDRSRQEAELLRGSEAAPGDAPKHPALEQREREAPDKTAASSPPPLDMDMAERIKRNRALLREELERERERGGRER